MELKIIFLIVIILLSQLSENEFYEKDNMLTKFKEVFPEVDKYNSKQLILLNNLLNFFEIIL